MSLSTDSSPPVDKRQVIRENDYYGGDLTVTLEPDRFTTDEAVVIEWEAWGDYGTARIVLTLTEAKSVMRSLAQLLYVAEQEGLLP